MLNMLAPECLNLSLPPSALWRVVPPAMRLARPLTVAPMEAGNELRAAEQMLLAFLSECRKRKGSEWCRKHGVGAMRESIGEPMPANVIALAGAHSPAVAAFMAERQRAASALANACAICGRCKWAGK